MAAKVFPSALSIVTLAVLSGCVDQSPNTAIGDKNNTKEPKNSAVAKAGAITKQIDATAGGRGAAVDDAVNKYTYFDLDTGEVVSLTDAESKANSEWDVAFKRTNLKLNGGVSGPGSVTGGVADAQDDFYDAAGDADNSVFLNATSASELEAFDAVVDFADLKLKSDRNIPYVMGDGTDAGWWLYAGPPTHAVTANPDQWWLVRSAGADSYAKFHVTDIVQASRDISLEMFIQGTSDSAFSDTATTWTAAIGAAGGSKCFDIDSAAEADCAQNDWDIKVEVAGSSWNIWTNGGVSGDGLGGAFGSFDNEKITDYGSGTVNASGTDISKMYGRDSAGGTFKDNTWYAYSLQKNNKLWPNYRVFAIDTGTTKYKMQILSFYDDAGASGMIKFRYEAL